MKRIILLLISIITCFSLSACGEPELSPEECVRETCRGEVLAMGIINQKLSKSYADIVTVRQQNDTTYVCTGTITFVDNYGDESKSKFEATYEYDNKEKRAYKVDMELLD